MPVPITYPGVYVEEVPTGGRSIAGVETSIGAFLGWAARGPVDQVDVVRSWPDFEKCFGGLDRRSLLGYSVRHFFDNGGATAWIARLVHTDAVTASVSIPTATQGTA